MAGKKSRVLGNVSLYSAPFPVYDRDGYDSDAVNAGPEDGAEATSYVGITGPYVDSRGPYVDSRGPYIDGTDTDPPEAPSFANVPQAAVPIPPEDAGFATSSLHSPELRSTSSAPTQLIDNSDVWPRFWIALKNHWVYTATDYWVEGGTLHYITTQGDHNQVSIQLVDWQTSAMLDALGT